MCRLGVGNELLDTDVLTLQTLAQTVAHRAVAEHEVIGCGKHVAVGAHRYIHLAVVESVAQRLHRDDLLAVVGELHATHTAVEVVKVALRNLVAAVAQFILHIDVVGDRLTADKVARETCIGLRNADAEFLLDALLCRTDGATHRFGIYHTSGIHTVDRLRHDAADIYEAICLDRANGDYHICRTYVNCYNLLTFHRSVCFILIFNSLPNISL